MVENTPPIDASAPYGSLPSRIRRLVAPHVAVGEARLRDVLRVVGRGRHAERPEDPVAHEVAVLLPAGGRDDPPEDPVAEVRVLERGPGRPGERRACGEEPLERVERQALLPVAPRIVGREAGRHRQEVPDRDRRRVGRRRRPAGQRGHVHAHRVVEPEAALVAQQQDGRRRERLGHRGDPVDRVGVGPAVLAVADGAGAARVRRAAPSRTTPQATPGILASRARRSNRSSTAGSRSSNALIRP